MHFFYSDEISVSPNIWLAGIEAHHAIHVLRMQTGERLFLLNGCGNIAEGIISAIQNKKCRISIQSVKTIQKEFPGVLHIAIAPVKSMDRWEWLLEKACELGADIITPLLSRNSERNKLNLEKCNAQLVAALKQSGRAWKPVINAFIHFEKFINQNNEFAGFRGIAHCYDSEKQLLHEVYTKSQSMLMLIGPEGDFSKEEVNLAITNNFVPVSLGKYRLRTETAAIETCVLYNLLNRMK